MALPFEREDVIEQMARVVGATDNALLSACLLQLKSDADEIERLRSVIHRRLKMTLPDEVDELAQIIRKVDGKSSLGAGALAEAIVENYSHK